MFYLDPLFLLMSVPAMLFALWAQYRVKSTFNKYARVRNMQGLSGLETARILMRAEGLEYLQIKGVPGQLTDFYNPADKSINLSEGSTSAPSVAGMAVVAHELGHAVQDKQGYAWMRIRSGIVGIANVGSNLGVWLFFGGMVLQSFSSGSLGFTVALFGVILFAAAVAFTLVTLPVEFNASNRAREMLMRNGLVSREEATGVNAVLNAAALTYVAAAAQSISQLLYFALILFGGRSRD